MAGGRFEVIRYHPLRLIDAIWQRLAEAELRKQRSLTQQALADRVGIHAVQLRRYESGSSQPTLEVIRKLAVALSVSGEVVGGMAAIPCCNVSP